MSSNFVIIRAWIRSMRENDCGATAVEYGLILALIAAAIVAGLTVLGPQVALVFTNIQSGLHH